MLVPLYGFLEGDVLGLLVLAHHDMTMADLAERMRSSSRVRVAVDDALEVVHAGRAVDSTETVAGAGIEALDRIDVRRRRC